MPSALEVYTLKVSLVSDTYGMRITSPCTLSKKLGVARAIDLFM